MLVAQAWPWPPAYLDSGPVSQPAAALGPSSSSPLPPPPPSTGGCSGAEAFACGRCGRRYSRRDTWRRHERFECGGRATLYCCPLCPSRSKYKRNMDVHIATLHAQRPNHPAPPPPRSVLKHQSS